MKKNITISILLIALCIGLVNSKGYASLNQEQIEKNLPHLLGASNQGLEFVLSFVPAWVTDRPPNGVGVPGIRIYVSSAVEANVRVYIKSKDFEKTVTTVPNSTSEIFIPYNIAQVATKHKDKDIPEPAKVYPGGAIIVTSDAPIVCCGLLRYPYSSDGYLALPVSSLGKEYVVASYNGPTDDPDKYGGQYLTSYSAIVGAYDNTKVKFTYGGRLNGRVETSDGKILKSGESDTKTLNRGDVWLIPARGSSPDITGSFVEADKPVACFSGSFCPYIPISKAACDYIVEQDAPMHTWGKKYYVTPIKNRLNGSVLRIFTSKDSSNIFRDGWVDQVADIPLKYGSENMGWIEIRAIEGWAKPVTILSKDRINVVQYNPSYEDDHTGGTPFEMTLSPVEQFRNQITFSVPGIKKGLKYKENYINLVYRATTEGKIPEDMEISCIDSISGDLYWKKLSDKFGSDSGFIFIDPTNPTPERSYYCKQIILPLSDIETYSIRAKDKFMAYGYGSSNYGYDSYGLPYAFYTVDMEKNDVVCPRVVFSMDEQGNVPNKKQSPNQTAYAMDLPDDEAVRTNLSLVYFDKTNSYNYEFTCDPFIAGKDNKVNWSLKPINPKTNSRAVITFADRNGNDTTIIIEHIVNYLDISPHDLNFGVLKVGESKSSKFTITNRSAAASVKVTKLKLLDGNKGFKLKYSFDIEKPLAPGESREFEIEFSSDKEGKFIDTIYVGDGTDFWNTGYVRASAAKLTLNVSNVEFAKNNIHRKNPPKLVTVKNTGTGYITITGYSNLTSGFFETDLDYYDIRADNPYILYPDQELLFQVWFNPEEAKIYKDSIVFECSADGEDLVCLVNGKGVDPVITVSDAYFPKTDINKESKEIAVTIKNTSSDELTIYGYSGLRTGKFVTNLPGNYVFQYNPIMIQPNETYLFYVRFLPTEEKIYNDSIVFITDALSEDSVCALQGEGWVNVSAPEAGIYTLNVKILPNPLDSRGGQLEFENPVDGTVEILLFNSLNQQVAVLQSGWMKAGRQSIRIPVETHPSGAYTYRITAGKIAVNGNLIISK